MRAGDWIHYKKLDCRARILRIAKCEELWVDGTVVQFDELILMVYYDYPQKYPFITSVLGRITPCQLESTSNAQTVKDNMKLVASLKDQPGSALLSSTTHGDEPLTAAVPTASSSSPPSTEES